MKNILLKIATILIVAVLTLPANAVAEIIAPTTGTTDFSGWGADAGGCKTAMSFAPTVTGVVSSSTITYGVNNFPTHLHTDDMIISIQGDSAGSPDGTDIVSEQYTPADLYAMKYLPIAWSPTASLSSGVTYWLVFSRSGSCSGTSYYAHYGSATDVAGFVYKRQTGSSSYGTATGAANFMVEVVASAAAPTGSTAGLVRSYWIY